MAELHSELRVSDRGLREARRQLTYLEDIHLEEEGSVPVWLRTCRLLVDAKLEEVETDE